VIDTKRFSERVAGKVRAALAERNMPKIALMEPLNLSESQVYARTQGRIPFPVEELAIIADLLDVEPSEFIPPLTEGTRRASA
jgi:hypothetical protein